MADFSMRKVLVTGAAGFIGHHVVKVLLEQGATVVALDDLSVGRPEMLPFKTNNRYSFIKADVADEVAVTHAMQGCTDVVHLAALASVPLSLEEPAHCFRSNVVGTERVLTAAKLHALPGRALLASSADVYGHLADPKPCREEAAALMVPYTPHAASKRMNEQQAMMYREAYGLRTTCLRFFNVYGPEQPISSAAGVLTRVWDSIRNGTLLTIYGDGLQTRDYIAVADVVTVILRLLATPATQPLPPVMNLGTGVATSLLDAIRHMVAVTKVNPRVEYRPARAGDANFSCADITLLKQTLPGWQPHSFAEGVRSWLLEKDGATPGL